MRKGFTLMELMIVIIIIGILATLGFAQYTKTVEKSRGAEAKQMLGHLRTMCAVKYMEGNNASVCDDTFVNDTGLPSANCTKASHFRYTTAAGTDATYQRNFTATRCKTGGKSDGDSANAMWVLVNYSSGVDDWNSTAAYK